MQETGLKFIPNLQSKEIITGLCQCLCTFAEVMLELERAEQLRACLELLYNMLPKGDSKEATMILEVLRVTNHVIDLENDMNQLNI